MSLSHRAFKDSIYEQHGRIGKAIAAPKRIEILDLLCQGPRTVEDLAEQAGTTVANASQHLQVLRAARLVETERRGTYVEYRLADEHVLRLFHALRGLAESRLAEIEQLRRAHLEAHGALEPVGGEDLLRRVRKGEVVVLDVRPEEEYRAGHIPGALSIPLPELKRRLAELPRDCEIVAYCRGPYCLMAIEAVALLRKKGLSAQRMEQGVIDWRARGWPIEAEEVRT